jgi:hypothetical protein
LLLFFWYFFSVVILSMKIWNYLIEMFWVSNRCGFEQYYINAAAWSKCVWTWGSNRLTVTLHTEAFMEIFVFWCEGFLQFLDLLITFKDIWRVWDKRILVPQGFCLKKSISFNALKWTSLCQSVSWVQNFLSLVDFGSCYHDPYFNGCQHGFQLVNCPSTCLIVWWLSKLNFSETWN